MTEPIQSWSDGYRAIRERAEVLRGVCDDGPATTNADVIAIAAVLAPAIQARSIQFADDGLGRTWRDVLYGLERNALGADPTKPYVANAAFWSVIEPLCAYLDETPVPELWTALADHLGEDSIRNAGPKQDGPFAHFEAKTYDDLWRAQRDFLAEKRGFDQPPPPTGTGMQGLKVPRSTNQDILQLATYWSEQLAKAKQVLGYKAAVEKWHAVIADVETHAKTGKPDDVYAKNNEFWHVSNDIAVQIAIGDEAPGNWDLFVDSLKDSVTHLPQTLEHAASKSVDFVASAAHAAGKIANEAGKGLFSGLGLPVLIGGGLIGLYLITRSRGDEE
jgi:hypothetical protein